MLSQQILTQTVLETRRRMMDESVGRIKKCLYLLSEEEIWHRPNEHTVSIGNLVVHLCGNARQWMLSGLGGYEDRRRRSEEFDKKGPMATSKLLEEMDTLMAEINKVLEQLSPEELVKPRKVQGFDETGIGIIMHVVEHFSYHTGQIVYYTKTTKNIDLGFYKDVDLSQTS